MIGFRRVVFGFGGVRVDCWPMKANLFENIPANLDGEVFETLLKAAGVRVERIISTGQASPEGFWYDQKESEWVLVVAGAARLQIEGEQPVELGAGDYMNLPAGCRHRVDWTDEEQQTVWLAIFYE